MKRNKLNNGITLIALIITIIILLILAVVTIGSIKNNNIMGYAQNASTNYEKEKDEEGKTLLGYEGLIAGTKEGVGKAKVGTIVKSNSTINGAIYSSNNPIIPMGFKAINTETSSWDLKEGPQVSKGLVIEDGDENQFVWIPVYVMKRFAVLREEGSKDYKSVLYSFETNTFITSESNYKEPGISEWWANGNPPNDSKIENLNQAGITDIIGNDGINQYDLQKQLQNEFNDMVESVKKYGGFYVGRYETSLINNKIPQSKAGEKPATAKYESGDTWYGLYNKSKAYSKNGVVSEMICGCQWDEMMRFIGDAATKLGKVSHGEKAGISKTYLTGGGEYPEGATIPYGDIINNIYDLEGNICEFTKETATSKDSKIARGGSYKNNVDYIATRGTMAQEYPSGDVGSRLSLYIK